MQILRKITPVYRTEKTIQVNPLPPLFREFNLRRTLPIASGVTIRNLMSSIITTHHNSSPKRSSRTTFSFFHVRRTLSPSRHPCNSLGKNKFPALKCTRSYSNPSPLNARILAFRKRVYPERRSTTPNICQIRASHVCRITP